MVGLCASECFLGNVAYGVRGLLLSCLLRVCLFGGGLCLLLLLPAWVLFVGLAAPFPPRVSSFCRLRCLGSCLVVSLVEGASRVLSSRATSSLSLRSMLLLICLLVAAH